MKKIQRQVLFYVLIGVFFVTTPIVLVYAIGYSIDFRNQSFLPAGGIFIKTNQTGIKVFLNGKKQSDQKSSSFLSSGILFNNLTAGVYDVRIEKEGFRTWEKKIEIRQRIVSEYRNIFLVPQNPPVVAKKEVIRVGSFEYIPSPDGIYTALLFNSGRIAIIERNLDHAIVFRKEFPFELEKIMWLGTATAAFQSSADGFEWSAVEFSANGQAAESKIVLRHGRDFIAALLQDPRKSGSFFGLTKSGSLYSIPSSSAKAEKIGERIVYAGILQDGILFINDTGFLATADFTGTAIAVVGRPGFFLRGEYQSFILPDGSAILIDGVGGAFYFDRLNSKVAPVGSSVKKASFNKKSSLALLQKEHELFLVFLADETDAPFRRAFSEMPVVRGFPEKIIDSIWYGKQYILFTTASGLYGAEFGLTADDTVIQKLSSIGGVLVTDDIRVTLVNSKGIYTLAIE